MCGTYPTDPSKICLATRWARFRQLRGYAAGSFALGWTSVVPTTNGILFYNKSTGRKVVGEVTATGDYHDTYGSVETLRTGWDKVVAVGSDVLFYDNDTGGGSIGAVSASYARLVWKKLYPGGFFKGWDQIVATFPTY